MKKLILTFCIVIIGFGIAFQLSGCRYDKEVTPPSCDSTNMTYTADIRGLLNANCTTCHYQGNPSSIGGGYNFENYNGIKTQAQNGNLLATINHVSGASPMPKNSPKLSNCDIGKFTNWVQHGAPQ